jgi:hypothetical protein
MVKGSAVAWSVYSLDICLEEWNEFMKNVMIVCVLCMHVATSSYLVYHQKQNQLLFDILVVVLSETIKLIVLLPDGTSEPQVAIWDG